MPNPWQGVCLSAVEYAAAWLSVNRVMLPADIVIGLWDATKTYEHYSRSIRQRVEALYAGEMTEGAFVDFMAEIIPQQLRRAWNEGMRENGLDPETEMEPEWEDQLQAMIESEFDFVDGFAADIVDGAKREAGVDQFLARADLWANRYNDVLNEARLMSSDARVKYVWRLGATEEHCQTCAALNGIVATSREWEESRFRPQEPPNELLECGGWRCDCSLEKTSERKTPGALDKLLTIATMKFT